MATILIVDDHSVNRQFLASLLGYAGHRMLEAENGAQALEIGRAEHPDLIITDILMPVMDGYEFVRQLRPEADFARIPVIFYSATYREREVRALAKVAGVQYVLSKPAEPQTILNVVNAALGLRPPSTPPSEILTKPLLDPVQVISSKLTAKMGELGSLSARLSEVIKLGLEISAERDTARLLENFCESARQILKARYAAVGIFAKDGRSLQHFIPSGMDPETVASLGLFPTGKGLLGVLLPEGIAIRLRDLTADPRSAGFPEGHPMMYSFLGVPISTSLQAYGQLYFTEKVDAEEFSEDDERLALMLAAQLAVAYENAFLYDEIQRHDISQKIEMTERQQAEAALQISEELFRTTFQYASVGMCMTSLDGTLLKVNQALVDMLGHTKADLEGKPFNDITHPEGLEIGREMVRKMLSGEIPSASFEKRYLKKSGEPIWAQVNSALLKDSSGRPIHFITHILNISERKRAEETILKLAAIVESSDDAIIGQSLDGIIISWNLAAESLYGYSADEVKGKPISILVPSGRSDEAFGILERLKEGEHIGHFDTVRVRKDGQPIHISTSVSSIKDATGALIGISAMERDISERHRAEEAIRQISPVERGKRLSRLLREFAVLFVIGLVVVLGLGYYFDLFESFAGILARYDLFDELFFGLIYLVFSFAFFSYQRWREADMELTQRQQAQDALRVLHSELETGVHERTADLAKSNIALKHEITERKQAEEALQQSEERYRSIFESAAVAIWEEDFTEVLASLERLQTEGIKDIREYLSRHPEFIMNAVGLVKVLDVNQQSLKMFGAARKNELLSSLDRVFLPETMTSFAEELVTLAEGQRYFEGEAAIQTLQGERREVLLTVQFAEAEKKLDRTLVSLMDISDRKRAEEQLRASEERFRALIENSADAIALTGADGTILFASPAYTRILGFTSEELVGHSAFELIHPDDIGIGADTLGQLLQAPEASASIQLRERHKDGSWRWLEGTAKNLLTNPSVLAIVTNFRDITDRKQAEEQIWRQLKHLNALRMIDVAISSSFDLGIILDIVLHQVLSQLGVDASAVLLFDAQLQTIKYAASRGFRSEALHFTDLKLGDGYAGRAVLERKTIHISDLMETGSKLASSLLLEHELFTEYYGSPLIVKGEVKGVLEVYHRSHLQTEADWLEFLETLAGQAAIAIDNAQLFENLQRLNLRLEQRVVERTAELHQTNAELEHANKVKDEFLANMSHELRTPLTSILGLSESLLEQRRGALNDNQQKSLQIIESSGRHLLELINDILDLSKIEAGKFDYYPQPISVDDICHASLAFIKAQAVKKSITVTYLNEATVSKIFADPRRLKQILVNLLTNAVKFTPEHGQVSLHVNGDLEQDLIRFSVIDTGIGIAHEDFARLFQPFVQVDSSLNRQQEGTGLGLALVQRLTDLHGGSVQVESEVDKGSRFTINLACLQDEIAKLETPLSHPVLPASHQADKTGAPSEASAQGVVVLLAEDNMANILTIGEYLESHGYEVVVAHDGSEAIEKAEALLPDLILMDIQMPGMDGLDATRHLRANPRFASTPIIALTALAMPGDRERCLLAGANEYMSKPVSLKALRQTIEHLLQGRPSD